MSLNTPITSIKQLVNELDNAADEEAYRALVKRLDLSIEEYLPYAHFAADQYTRNCIARSDEYELLLLCWDKDQDTPIHCHNNQECWVYVVKGSFIEQRFVESEEEDQAIELSESVHLEKEEVSYMNDDMGFHLLANTNSQGKSMSLHLYINPIDSCQVWDENAETFKRKELDYYSFEGKVLQEDEVERQ